MIRRHNALVSALARVGVANAVRSQSSNPFPAEPFAKTDIDEADLDDMEQNIDMPFSHGLALKADAMEAELRRLYHTIVVDEQMLNAPSPYSFLPATCDSTVGVCQGTSSLLLGPIIALFTRRRAPENNTSSALTELKNDAFARKMALAKSHHKLNYYSTINVTPKKNIWLGLYHIVWNSYVALQNAVVSLVVFPVRGYTKPPEGSGPLVAAAKGLLSGVGAAFRFLWYGWLLSPLIHVPNGIVNSCWGFMSFLKANVFFDPRSGRWYWCDTRHASIKLDALLENARIIKTIGVTEFKRKRMKSDQKFTEELKKMGFKLRKKHREKRMKSFNKANGRPEEEEEDEVQTDPYEVLQVRRTATAQQIKAQYKKLAKVFHPDVAQAQKGGPLNEQERKEATQKFEGIAEAYQILSNPEKRKAFDTGGRQGLRMHETQFGRFAGSSTGEVTQGVFGGRVFRETLIGDLLGTHFELRFHHHVSVSMHDFEVLQATRVSVVALKILQMIDVHANGKSQGKCPPSVASPSHETQQTSAGAKERSGTGTVPPKAQRFQQTSSKATSFAKASDKSTNTQQNEQNDNMPKTASRSDLADTLLAQPNEFNQFTPEFMGRTAAFVKALSEASFGQHILYDVGDSYCTSALRFLNAVSFYEPKVFLFQKSMKGFARLAQSFKAQVGGKSEEELARMIIAEYFNLEYDNIIFDVSLIVRYAVQVVLQDVSVDETVRKKRCYALMYIGREMMKRGQYWGNGYRDDQEMTAYLQQAVTSTKTSGPPPVF